MHLVSLRNRKKELREKGEWNMKDLEDKEDLLYYWRYTSSSYILDVLNVWQSTLDTCGLLSGPSTIHYTSFI